MAPVYRERLDDVDRFLTGREKMHPDDTFDTVLDWAVAGGNLVVVQYVIQQGASLDGRSYPLHVACIFNQTAVIRYLIHLGLDVKRETSSDGNWWSGVTPLKAVFGYRETRFH